MLFRAAFWLLVLTLLLPPQYRPLPFVQFKLPERLGHGSHWRELAVPDNHYCEENRETCLGIARTLDAITAAGLAGLGYVREAVESERSFRSDRDGDDRPLLGHLIDS